jgi:hypothetical protein
MIILPLSDLLNSGCLIFITEIRQHSTDTHFAVLYRVNTVSQGDRYPRVIERLMNPGV